MTRLVWILLFSIGCAMYVGRLDGCEAEEVDARQVAKPFPVGSLELRLLASRTNDNSNDFDSLVNDVVEKGPKGTSSDAFAWYEVADATASFDDSECVVSPWEGRKFILASTALDQVLDGRTSWKVTSFKLVKHDRPFGVSIIFELDKAGGEQLRALTAAHLERSLGIFLFGKLETSATIMDVISERISLSGDPDSMEQLYRRLQETAQSP